MSNATKCDRCGACYEYGGMTVGEEYDLCDGCVVDFEAWMECQPVTGAPERVTNEGEMLHDTREKLEADVLDYQGAWPLTDSTPIDVTWSVVRGWLDRQVAITERECMERSTSERIGFDCAECAEGMGRELEARCYHLKARIAELKAKLDAEAQHAREAWQLWGEADARAEQAETERDEMAQRIQTLELEIAKRDKGIERLKRRRGELTEQLGAMADRMAKDGR